MKCLTAKIIIFFFAISVTYARVDIDRSKHLIAQIHTSLSSVLNHNSIEVNIAYKREGSVGAFSKWIKKKKIGQITFSEKLFDLKSLDYKGLALITCHEFGHFLGGAPFVKAKVNNSIFSFKNSYVSMSAEGQADFFSTSVCMPLLKGIFDSSPDYKDGGMDEFCDEKRADCILSVEATENALDTYIEIMKSHGDNVERGSIFSLVEGRTDRTLDKPGEYPSIDCRMLTMVNGLSCIEVKESGRCLLSNGLVEELRPACWFLPE